MIDNFLQKLRHRRLVVILTPIIGGVFFGGLMVVKPTLARISSIETEKAALSKKAEVFNNIIGWEKKMSVYKKQLAPIEDKAKVMELLNMLAGDSGINIISMTPDETAPVGLYLQRVLVRIEADAGYHQLGEFVSRVESLDQFVKFVNVQINTEITEEPLPSTGMPTPGGPAGVLQPKIGGSPRSYRIALGIGFFYAQKDAL